MKQTQRTRQKDQTRRRIIQTAFAEFTEKGLLTASTADIAKSAGVAHGTVFAHFPTRDDLLTAVIEEFGGAVTGRIHELASRGGSLPEVLDAHLKGLKEFEPFYIRMLTEETLLPDGVRNTLIGIQSALSFHIIQTAEKEMASGILRPLPLHLVFNHWIALIHYYLMNHEYFAPDGSVIERCGEELTHYFLALLTVPNESGEKA